ncbi:hypothetical protein ACGFNY_44665 [Streptomyces chartreusis]|uniref:hypothetical protein n=1 Tax=Streptomyces chartreusis TaxID=1969 RepID=UPI00371B235E
MVDAEERLRLAAEDLNRDALGFDARAFTQQLLDRLGITPAHEGSAGDSSLGTGRHHEAGPERSGRRNNRGCSGHDGFFDLELEELVNDTTLHSQPRVLRRIAELTEFLVGGREAREWWLRAAERGDKLAKLTLAEWDMELEEEGQSESRQTHGS